MASLPRIRSASYATPGWFNPEALIAQAREWQREASAAGVSTPAPPQEGGRAAAARAVAEAGSGGGLVEQLLVIGLPDMDPQPIVQRILQSGRGGRHGPPPPAERRHRASAGRSGDRGGGLQSARYKHYRKPDQPTLPPQILFTCPGRLPAADVGAFCFPSGVPISLVRQSPSLSECLEVAFGQHPLSRQQSYVFVLTGADRPPLFACCTVVQEMLHQVPRLVSGGARTPPRHPAGRYLVVAPRCYCLLTHFPLFRLHFSVLGAMLGQERLHRISALMEEIAPELPLAEAPAPERCTAGVLGPGTGPAPAADGGLWRPADTTPPTATAGGRLGGDAHSSEQWKQAVAQFARGSDDAPSTDEEEEGEGGDARGRRREPAGGSPPPTPPLPPPTQSSARFWARREDIAAPRASPGRSRADHAGAELVGVLEDLVDESASETASQGGAFGQHGRSESHSSLDPEGFRSFASEASSDAGGAGPSPPDDAPPSQNILDAYLRTPVPEPGEELRFVPLKGLDAVAFRRVSVEEAPGPARPRSSWQGLHAVVPDDEVAVEVQDWAAVVLCQALSLDSILSLLQAALLEHQIVVFCPDLGTLSGTVCAVLPLLRPFRWQSVLLPILPTHLTAFLEAPVPFLAGFQYKTPTVRQAAQGVVRVNVYKDSVASVGALPALPGRARLAQELAPAHAALRALDPGALQPGLAPSARVRRAVQGFLGPLESHLQGWVRDLPKHAITDVGGGGRVSLLMKDSFVGSFPANQRPFMAALTETQAFAAYSDAHLRHWNAEQEKSP